MAVLEEYAYPGFGVDYDNLPAGFDFSAAWKEEDARIRELREKGLDSPTLKGYVWRQNVADGYAMYIVTKLRPLTLAFINQGDSYAVPEAHIRGLNKADLEEAKEWDLRWRASVKSNQSTV